MADFWDDFDWSPPPEEQQPAQPQPVDPGGGAAPAASGWGVTSRSNSGAASRSGMPSAFTQYAQPYMKSPGQGLDLIGDTWKRYYSGDPRYQSNIDQMVGNYGNVWNTYQNMPNQIENLRKAQNEQFMAAIPDLQKAYQPVLENMSQRGILNSSITGGALGDIQNDINRQVLQQIAGANAQAAQQNVDFTKSLPDVINAIVGGLSGASGQYGSFMKDAAGVGASDQQLRTAFLDLLKTTDYNQWANSLGMNPQGGQPYEASMWPGAPQNVPTYNPWVPMGQRRGRAG